jgi:DNA-binding transcriptional ArsR family regulator
MDKKPYLIKNRLILKIVADPLRGHLLEILVPKPLTVKQAAAKLGLSPSKLYYHFNMLEKHALIRVVETRKVANMLEKTYQAVAPRLEVAPALMKIATDEGRDVFYELVTSTLDTTREDLLRSLQTRFDQLDKGAREKPRRVIINRDVRCIPDARAVEFVERVKKLLEDFAADEVPSGTSGAMNYGLAVAFYPNFLYEEINEHE